MTTIPPWWAAAGPSVPEALARHLDPRVTGGVRPGQDVLAEVGLETLRRSLRPDGLERGGAYTLLAADALLTWAAETALESERPDAALDTLVRAVAGEAGDG